MTLWAISGCFPLATCGHDIIGKVEVILPTVHGADIYYIGISLANPSGYMGGGGECDVTMLLGKYLWYCPSCSYNREIVSSYAWDMRSAHAYYSSWSSAFRLGPLFPNFLLSGFCTKYTIVATSSNFLFGTYQFLIQTFTVQRYISSYTASGCTSMQNANSV